MRFSGKFFRSARRGIDSPTNAREFAMGEWSRYLLSLPELCRACRRHWLAGSLVAGGLFLILAIITFCLPRTYQSEAKLFVKVGRETLTLDPTATTGQTVSIYESRENEINSILEVLRSREVLEGVVDLLGVDALLHRGPLPSIPPVTTLAPEQGAPPVPRTTALPVDRAAREQAVLRLERQLHIWSPKRSSIVIVHCRAGSPLLAQAIIDAVLAVYRGVHAEVNSTKGSYHFFVEQEHVLLQKWQQATAELRDAKDRMGLASLTGKRAMIEGQLSDVQQKLLAAQAEMAAAEGKIKSLRTQLAETPKFTETSRAESANVAADTMRGSLYQLQIKEQELLARYTSAHPLVTDLQEQVAELRSLLAEEGRTRVQSTSSLNPAWSQLEASMLTETSTYDSLRSRTARLEAQCNTLLGDLRTLNGAEIQLVQLQQTVDFAEKSYAETAQRLEQARIHRALANEQITNVNVFQPATYVSKAIAPKRTLLLALSLLVSAMSGAATVVGLAYGNRHFHSLAEVAHRLRLPVVATLTDHSWQPVA
jgi:uncharacterized protein involved in exopolysaccharide biosynthesis